MHRSNIFQIPNTVCEQEVTLTWPFVWEQLQVEASGQVRREPRLSPSCTNWSTCKETRAVKKEQKQTNVLMMMMMMMSTMMIRRGLMSGLRNVFTHRFLIFFTRALADLTILLIRTCRQPNIKSVHFSSPAHGIFLFKNSCDITKLLTCCFLYKRGMEKTAMTAVGQNKTGSLLRYTRNWLGFLFCFSGFWSDLVRYCKFLLPYLVSSAI